MRSSTSSSAQPQLYFSRGGFSIIYIPLILLLLIAFVAMAVDTGRIRLAKAQLQGAADAAARAGASSLPNYTIGSCAVRAETVAELNVVAETQVQLDPNTDLQWGVWNPLTKLFSPITDNAGTPRDERNGSNACRAVALVSSTRGNSVPLWITPHVTTFDRKAKSSKLSTVSNLNTEAIAYISKGPTHFGFVGIDSVTFSGHPRIVGATPPDFTTENDTATVASNGNIDLGSQGIIRGDARPGIGQTITGNIDGVTGWTAPLDQVLAYDPVNPADASGATPLSGSGPFTVTGSGDPNNRAKYVVTDLTKAFNISNNGYVDLYVTGSINQAGNNADINTTLRDPKYLTIKVVGSGDVNFHGNAENYAYIYAPQSAVTLTGNGSRGHFYGGAIGKTLRLTGNTDAHDAGGSLSNEAYLIQLVK